MTEIDLTRDDGVQTIRSVDRDVRHHTDKSVLFDVERSRVQTETPAAEESGYSPNSYRQDPSKDFAERIRNYSAIHDQHMQST